MKKHTILRGGVFAVVLVLALAGCRQPSSGEIPVVTGVTVTRIAGTPLSADSAGTVQRGGTAGFAAVVEGVRQPPQSVNWYIVDDGRHGGTGINAGGVLRVDTNEPLRSLTIGARSTFDMRRFGHITVYVEGEAGDSDRLGRPWITLAGSVLIWEPVPGAGGYSLRVGGTEVPGGSLGRNARSFDLAGLPLPEGNHPVTLVAIGIPGQSLDSPESNTVIFPVTGAAQPGLSRLPAPVISRMGSMVSWVPVPGAGGYSLRIGGIEVPGGDVGPGIVSFDLLSLPLPAGDHAVTLVALGIPGQSLNSPASDPVTHTVPPGAWPGFPQLAAPEIALSNSTLSWAGVPGAGGYSLRVGGIEIPGGNLGPGETGFNLADLGLPAGDHFVTLVALGVPGQSLSSQAGNKVTYTVTGHAGPGLPPLPAPVITLDGATVSWAVVPGAGGYSLRVGGIERARIGHLGTDFNLSGLGLPVGAHSVTLVALGVPGQSLNSPASGPVTFYVIIATGVTVTVTVPDLRDMAAYMDILGPSFSLLEDPPGQIVFDGGPYDVNGVEWRLGENPVPPGTFATTGNIHTLTLNREIHGNMEGTHFVTLEVTIDGVRYSRVVAFTVRL